MLAGMKPNRGAKRARTALDLGRRRFHPAARRRRASKDCANRSHRANGQIRPVFTLLGYFPGQGA